MFPNLEAEMARSKITQLQMAEMLGVTPTTLSFKFSFIKRMCAYKTINVPGQDT